MTNYSTTEPPAGDEAQETVRRLMRDYNLDEDTAVRVQDIMSLKGVSEDVAVEQEKEQENN